MHQWVISKKWRRCRQPVNIFCIDPDLLLYYIRIIYIIIKHIKMFILLVEYKEWRAGFPKCWPLTQFLNQKWHDKYTKVNNFEKTGLRWKILFGTLNGHIKPNILKCLENLKGFSLRWKSPTICIKLHHVYKF